MSSRLNFLFFTLVLFTILSGARSAEGAPSALNPDLSEPAQKHNPPVVDETRSADTLDISKPPPSARTWSASGASDDFFYAYRKSLAMRIGINAGSTVTNGINTPAVTGVQFTGTDAERRVIEFGADILSDGTGDLQLSRRAIFSRTRFRPYVRGGVGLLINPQDQLAAFIKYQNYRLLGAGGFEYTLQKSASVRLEAEASLSGNGLQSAATIGYVWAW